MWGIHRGPEFLAQRASNAENDSILMTSSWYWPQLYSEKKCTWPKSFFPRMCGNGFQSISFKLISWIEILSIFCKVIIIWMSQNSIDDKSTLIQVMAWCRQAASHYLNQRWPSSLTSYCVTSPHWGNIQYITRNVHTGDVLFCFIAYSCGRFIHITSYTLIWSWVNHAYDYVNG